MSCDCQIEQAADKADKGTTEQAAKSLFDNVSKGALIGTGVAATVVLTAVPVLALVGFGPLGVVAGSWAAGMQGSAVAAGSLFASCQSIAATGLGLSATTGILATGTVVGGVAGKVIEKAGKQHCEHCGKSKEETKQS